MADAADALLKNIAKLQSAGDVAGLNELENHDVKAVRKAARKALHTLRAQGVEVERGPRAWKPNAAADTPSQVERAMIDALSNPGQTRFIISDPRDQDALLHMAALTANDQLLDFRTYRQTDGQQSRLLRQWERSAPGRDVPAAYAKARVRWAREHTMRQSFQVPPAVNSALARLGEVPTERPAHFIYDQLKAAKAPADKEAEGTLIDAGVHRWPPLLPMNGLAERIGKIHGDIKEPPEEARRLEVIAEAAKDDEALLEGLREVIAPLLEDVAASRWVMGESHDAVATALLGIAASLRAKDALAKPETVRLLSLQLGSLVPLLAQQQRQRAAVQQSAAR